MTVNRPNGHKIYKNLPLQVPPKFTHISTFGLKICNLATLVITLNNFRLFGGFGGSFYG
jgi:hypothetical protein